MLAKLDIGEIAFHEPSAFGAEGTVTGLNVLGFESIDILAADHEVYGTAERIGYLPSGGQRNAAIDPIASALVARISGTGNAERLGEVFCRAEARLTAEALERSFSADGVFECASGDER